MAITGSTKPRPNPVATASGSLSRFVLNEDGPKHRLLLNVQGLEKTGKDHFGFTMPDPIGLLSFDQGLEGVIHKFNRPTEYNNFKPKRIYQAPKLYELSVQPGEASEDKVSAAAELVWKQVCKDYYDFLAAPEIRSILIDTGDELWELMRLHSFGKPSANVNQYGPVNAEFRRFVNAIKETDKNLCMLHKLKDEWLGKEDANGRYKAHKTGKLERAGFKEIGFMLQGNLQTWRDGDQNFHATMLDSRQNPSVDGMDFSGPMLNFQQVAMMVFPDSELNEWE